MSYTVEFAGRATKDMDSLPMAVRKRVLEAAEGLEQDPRPPGIVALKGYPSGNYRIRVGDYRIGYHVDDRARLVTIWQVGNRRRFYDSGKRNRR